MPKEYWDQTNLIKTLIIKQQTLIGIQINVGWAKDKKQHSSAYTKCSRLPFIISLVALEKERQYDIVVIIVCSLRIFYKLCIYNCVKAIYPDTESQSGKQRLPSRKCAQERHWSGPGPQHPSSEHSASQTRPAFSITRELIHCPVTTAGQIHSSIISLHNKTYMQIPVHLWVSFLVVTSKLSQKQILYSTEWYKHLSIMNCKVCRVKWLVCCKVLALL